MKKYNDIAQELKQWWILMQHIAEHKILRPYKMYSMLLGIKKSIGIYREYVPEVSDWLTTDFPMAITKCRINIIAPVNIFNNNELCKACIAACDNERIIFDAIDRGIDIQDITISYLNDIIKRLDSISTINK